MDWWLRRFPLRNWLLIVAVVVAAVPLATGAPLSAGPSDSAEANDRLVRPSTISSGDLDVAMALTRAGNGYTSTGNTYASAPADACSPVVSTFTDTATDPDTSFTVLEFTSIHSCSWTPPAGVTEVDALLVAGGGAGGGGIGGGGGGGEVVTLADRSVSGPQSITVGAGGVGAPSVGADGGDTTALGVTVTGGGGGGWLRPFQTDGSTGRDGGSGGGGGCYATGASVGAVRVTYGGDSVRTGSGSGNDGGNGTYMVAKSCIAGGGGGAGAVGSAGTSSAAGNGGAGISSTVTGATVFYGGGGGGGLNGDSNYGTPSVGGVGGGGAGGTYAVPRRGFDGTDGLGGGGGGGSNTAAGTNTVDGTVPASGGSGGDGVVVIRYETNWLSLSHGGGQQPGDYRYSTSTADWVTAPTVQLIAAGEPLSTSGVTVTASFSASAGSATLTNATAVTDTSGVADFSSLVLNGNAGTTGTLTFTATGYGSVTSGSVEIVTNWLSLSHGGGQQPGDYRYSTSTADWVTAPTVQLIAAGEPLSTSGVTVTASFSASAGSATLTNATAVTDTSGVADFSSLVLNGNAGTTGTLTFTATGYELVTSGSVEIVKAPQTITFADPAPSGATYGDPPIPVAPTASSGLEVTLVASDPTVCTVSGGGIDIVRAGSCTITASRAESQNHLAAADVVRTLTIAKANQAALSMTSASTAVFGERISLASSGGSGTGTVSFGVVSGTCTISSGSTLVLGDAGSLCEVAATKQTDANHLAITSATQTITIARAGQTLAFTSTVPTSPVSGDTYTPTAEALSTVTGRGSGVQPVFSVSGTCGLSGGVVTFGASGDCTITASATATTNFTAASDVVQTIAVGSINQNITFARPTDVAFGSSSVAMTATASSGLPVTYGLGVGTTNSACAVSSLGVVSVLAVGTCEVTASQVGDSQFAAASDVTRTFLITLAVATAPTLASASAGSQAITVAFTVPGFTGGVPVAGYEVTATPTGAGATVVDTACVASPCTIGGLVNGVEYTVTVAAINVAGTGPASTASGPLTPATAAYAVDTFSAVPGDTVVDLAWTALTAPQLGGGSFTRYEISIREAGVTPMPAWTLVTDTVTTQTADTFQVTGLDNGTSYEFRLVAITTANTVEIPGNTALVVQYPVTVPSAPRNLSVLAATATDVEFTWEVPLSDGGDAITSYSVTVTSTSPGATSPITCAVTGVIRRCTSSNLTNGAVYTFEVEAVNAMSTGANGSIATETYSVPSSDATLSALALVAGGSPVTLTPVFDPAVTEYSVTVPNTVSAVTVAATPSRPASTVRIGGAPVANGSASEPVPLVVGENTITVDVTASDQRFTEQYSVIVTRSVPLPVAEPPATDAPVVQFVGGDQRPFVTWSTGAGVAEMLAAYIDRDGSVRVAPHMVVGGSGPNPSLVIGAAGDLVMTVSGRESGATSVDPVTGRIMIVAGRTIEVTGSGFYPGSELEVWLFSDPVMLGTAEVASDGTWLLTARVPAGITPGDHHMQAEGMAGDGYERMVRASVIVENPLEVLTLPESGSDLRLLVYAIVLAALGALAVFVSTGRSRRIAA